MKKYSEKEIRIFSMIRIVIPEYREFIPGVDCGGQKPLGESSRCERICTGSDGLKSIYSDIKLPCGFQILKHQDFKNKPQEGIAEI